MSDNFATAVNNENKPKVATVIFVLDGLSSISEREFNCVNSMLSELGKRIYEHNSKNSGELGIRYGVFQATDGADCTAAKITYPCEFSSPKISFGQSVNVKKALQKLNEQLSTETLFSSDVQYTAPLICYVFSDTIAKDFVRQVKVLKGNSLYNENSNKFILSAGKAGFSGYESPINGKAYGIVNMFSFLNIEEMVNKIFSAVGIDLKPESEPLYDDAEFCYSDAEFYDSDQDNVMDAQPYAGSDDKAEKYLFIGNDDIKPYGMYGSGDEDEQDYEVSSPSPVPHPPCACAPSAPPVLYSQPSASYSTGPEKPQKRKFGDLFRKKKTDMPPENSGNTVVLPTSPVSFTGAYSSGNPEDTVKLPPLSPYIPTPSAPPAPQPGSVVFCSACGSRLSVGSCFCNYCGNPVEQKKEPQNVNVSQVQFSAATQRRIVKGEYSTIDITVYEEEYRHIADKIIAQIEGEAKEVIGGIRQVSKDTVIRIKLTSPDILLEDCEEEQTWLGKFLTYSFPIKVPETYEGKQILFIANVYFNDLIATKLKLVVDCVCDREQALKLTREDVLTGFISYASQDRGLVATIIQGMKKARPDMDVFFDVESLRSGENWETALYREIEARDVLFLCWSPNAKASKWVDAEWRYALATKGADAIEPVPLVSPDVCPPPEELSAKHFNDKALLYRNSGN